MDPALLRMDSADGPDAQQQVLSIEQIRCIRANNDYVERPVALELTSQPGLFYAHDDRHHHHHHHHHNHHHSNSSSHHPHPAQQSSGAAPPPGHMPRSLSGQQQQQHLPHLSRSSTVSSHMSRGSAASDTRLLMGLTPSRSSGLASVSGSMAVVSAQPKGEPQKKKCDALGKGGAVAGEDHLGLHLFICEDCGRCKCGECVAPRKLPSCWACGQRCLCSAESAVEYGTCLCCVKGLFYHCSSEDDEDNCADRPCACTSAHACARWGTMALLVPFLPCLCCYPPAKLCLALCQRGYDHATRPGCRCRNTNTVCRKISAAAAAATTTTNQPPPFQKSVEKPA